MVLQRDGTYKKVENYANAVVDMEHRVLVTMTVPEADYSSGIPNIGIFHQYDMTLYHDSIAQNVKDRIDAFTSHTSNGGGGGCNVAVGFLLVMLLALPLLFRRL